ncbi:hypothetical protein CPAR01_07611 [Colletotrichum paranaense]|uniref:Uncharacterized protein n=3 Tax=Colletotrichum acutatum species complex TaxID=2707335 RepID=A0AAI9Z9Z6_9PEZI|nr:uncharacterized protein CCOS01_00001 [Colletotrichum costaricense]XP_060348250.1 uncharacterized protein CPAR01_07611 [Colletotrichum paranaense]XP_060404053.1 uncharacterized protein CABS01_06150 [Colletotrichum abscissum]KAK1453048.1 hypothetical protein CMEL01_04707 [Colletotrichum melonis]KAK1516183.1 hypothetical protein CABS01_06150 [Colletotrichum abscissum]KAK1537498.1 hypothetical protein CPAR01_07611 [Colletotrichum paranaense]KAK1538687.1 hypothetical protein CCOS01_00001 [Colle
MLAESRRALFELLLTRLSLIFQKKALTDAIIPNHGLAWSAAALSAWMRGCFKSMIVELAERKGALPASGSSASVPALSSVISVLYASSVERSASSYSSGRFVTRPRFVAGRLLKDIDYVTLC